MLGREAHFCLEAKEAILENIFLCQRRGIDMERRDLGNASEDWLHRIGAALEMTVLKGPWFPRIWESILAMR
jgi:hypothetical protein